LESPSYQEVVRRFRERASATRVAAEVAAIDSRLGSTEYYLQRWLLWQFGCYFDPRPDLADGTTVAEWLRAIRDMLIQDIPSVQNAPDGQKEANAYLTPADASARAYTRSQHVGKSVRQLAARLDREPHLAAASSFFDDVYAQRGTVDALERLSRERQIWLEDDDRTRSFSARLDYPVGLYLVRGASRPVEVSGVDVVLQRSSAPGGYSLLTDYPGMWMAHLGPFLGGLFHRDWKLDHSSVEEAVRAFRNNASLARIGGVVSDIDSLLDAEIPFESLAALVLFRLHLDHDPTRGSDAMTMTEWLELVRDTLVSGYAGGEPGDLTQS